MANKTTWIPTHMNPVREGYYEAKEKGTGRIFDVKWKTLQDHSAPSFYVHKGSLGPFSMWEDVTHRVWKWRGLSAPGATAPAIGAAIAKGEGA